MSLHTQGPGGLGLPRYRSKQEVHAFKIAFMSMNVLDGGAELCSHPSLALSVKVDRQFVEIFKPGVGDYYAEADGAGRTFPPQVFERGYDLVEIPAPAAVAQETGAVPGRAAVHPGNEPYDPATFAAEREDAEPSKDDPGLGSFVHDEPKEV